ncbi:MAG: metallophosphoesterase [Clostridiales bacterium]|nr:metallophosphoesterase [Clostridiales bacterium]
MSLFAIGDTHLSLGSQKPMDIFKGWENYTDRLEKQWNAVVSDRDTVVINGDISWALKLSECYADFNFINNLNGKKIFIKGNHDYWWTTMKKMTEFLENNNFNTISILFNNSFRIGDYSVCGARGWFFDAPESDKKIILRERQRLIRSVEQGLELGGEPIVFLHYPPIYDDRICTEIFSVLTEYGIKRCFFGHIHSERSGKYEGLKMEGVKFNLISSDYLRFCPKLIEKF